jgi:hypothetical protein
MSLLPATNKQVPDHAIMDHFNKQVYLGNQYSVNKSFTIGTSEIALLLLNNVQTGSAVNQKALFQNIFKMALETPLVSLTFNAYLNPVITSAGTAVTPINMRPAYGNNSIATVTSSPAFSSIGTLVDSISAASQSVSLSELLRILDNGQSLLITGIGSAAGILSNLILQWYEI